MNYNDKIQVEEPLVLHTQQDDPYENQTFRQSSKVNRMSFKNTIQQKAQTIKVPLMRGKQNQCQNTQYNLNKNIVTNHSFNGFFNKNSNNFKPFQNKLVDQKIEFTDSSYHKYQIASPKTMNSSGKLSNLRFVGDSNKNYGSNNPKNSAFSLIHSQVKDFMKKYFLQNYQAANFFGQYVTLNDFVDILLEEFQNIIGKQSSFNLIQEFTDKVFLIFGQIIYFEDLFQKTAEKGLLGLIFQIVKSIQQDKLHKNQNSKLIQKHVVPLINQRLQNQNLKSVQNSKYSNKIGFNQIQNLVKSNSNKISLDKFFGSSVSKIQIQQQSTQISQQSLQEVKFILQSYIQQMYQEYESKLNRKYIQQMKKIMMKHKQVQKILQRINDKISNHYDSLQLEKQYQKKIKLMTQKQLQLQQTIKKLQIELKFSNDEVQKHKSIIFKSDQQTVRLKQKLDKYENAIFEKAMQKNSTQNSISNLSVLRDTSSNNIQHSSIYNQKPSQRHNQKRLQRPLFELKIDTFTQHHPVILQQKPLTIQSPHFISQSGSTTPLSSIPLNSATYSPYTSKIRRTNANNLTPNRHLNLTSNSKPREVTISPIKPRISFNKAPNPIVNVKNISNTNNVHSYY